MAENAPTLEEWKRLYEATIRVKELAPWEWMTEDIVFGVQNPETDELGFISVMGMLGEHFSIAVYLGPEGLYGFWEVEDEGPYSPPERILEVPQLQASFENRNDLRQQDRNIIKKLGLKFRGRHEWPMFRSYRPGFFPWFVEASEARFLAYALEQAADVTPRYQEDPFLLEALDDESYLVRVPRRQKNTFVWQDRITSVPPPEPAPIPIAMNVQALQVLKSRPRSKHKLEIDFFMFPSPFQDGKSRPYFAYMLMVVEAQSGMILGNELLKVETSLEEMWGQVPLHVVNSLGMLGAAPREVRVRSDLLMQLLQPLAKELRFKLKRSRTLPSLDEAKTFMLDRFT